MNKFIVSLFTLVACGLNNAVISAPTSSYQIVANPVSSGSQISISNDGSSYLQQLNSLQSIPQISTLNTAPLVLTNSGVQFAQQQPSIIIQNGQSSSLVNQIQQPIISSVSNLNSPASLILTNSGNLVSNGQQQSSIFIQNGQPQVQSSNSVPAVSIISNNGLNSIPQQAIFSSAPQQSIVLSNGQSIITPSVSNGVLQFVPTNAINGNNMLQLPSSLNPFFNQQQQVSGPIITNTNIAS